MIRFFFDEFHNETKIRINLDFRVDVFSFSTTSTHQHKKNTTIPLS
jgi:hypothetical protein